MSNFARAPLVAAWIVCIAFAASAPASEGPDDLWKVTAKLSMQEPMSMELPAFTSESCAPPQAEHGPPPMKNNQCTVDHYERDGDRVEFAVTCDQQGVSMTGEGWSEKTDADHYKGAMNMSGNASGQSMKMSMSFTGVRIGHCTAEPLPES